MTLEIESQPFKRNHIVKRTIGPRGMMDEGPVQYDLKTSVYETKDGTITINPYSFSESKKAVKNISAIFEASMKNIPDHYKHSLEDIFYSVYGDASFNANQRAFMSKVVEYIGKHYPNQHSIKYQLLLFSAAIFPPLFK